MREDFHRTRPGPFLAGHCSLHWVGETYARLRDLFGRERIIVIAQLQETLSWLRRASADETSAAALAGRASLLPMLRGRLLETERACARLLADGGSDYDGPDVNAATVLHVLRGDASALGERQSRRVVPRRGVGSLLLLLVSHGNAHPAHAGARQHEWYLHFPYPAPAGDDHLYDAVSYRGFEQVDPHPEWDWGAPKRRWRLYAQMLFQAHHEALVHAPRRRLVLFHQFCLSGGAAEFMRKPGYRSYFGTRQWPIFTVVTAGCFEPALGNFVDIWTREFAEAAQDGRGSSRTLGDVYDAAERKYWEANPELRSLNARLARAGEAAAPESEDAPTTVGTIGCESGQDGGLAAGVAAARRPRRRSSEQAEQ
ncbi:unnamed protein product, partial [Prorocentrum cordatum]